MTYSRRIMFTATLACTSLLTTTPSVAVAQGMASHDAGKAAVQVQNDRNVPVTVFIERGPFDVRIGAVAAMQTKTFSLPDWVVEQGTDVELYVHPEGGNDLESQHFAARRGIQLGLLVPVNDYPWTPEPKDTMSVMLTSSDALKTTLTVENGLDLSSTRLVLTKGEHLGLRVAAY